jgi:hypothetical protein
MSEIWVFKDHEDNIRVRKQGSTWNNGDTWNNGNTWDNATWGSS